ncbi:hypothetical protein FPK73_25135, partial [Acinetobacter baumannii]|nr:hypothetical protein [Acinetobacter baumannii]
SSTASQNHAPPSTFRTIFVEQDARLNYDYPGVALAIPCYPIIVQRLTMFSNRLASHLERGVVGFPTTLASSVGLIMA